jgi:hypothetical protein
MSERHTFKKTWWRGIVSDAGFSVKLRRPHSIEYQEGGRRLMAYMDMLVGNPAIDIDSTSIVSWEPPHQHEPITPERRRQIMKNICAALEYSGVTYVIR